MDTCKIRECHNLIKLDEKKPYFNRISIILACRFLLELRYRNRHPLGFSSGENPMPEILQGVSFSLPTTITGRIRTGIMEDFGEPDISMAVLELNPPQVQGSNEERAVPGSPTVTV